MRILILGITGMIGNILFKEFSKNKNFITLGTSRNKKIKNSFEYRLDINNIDSVEVVLKILQPDIVINTIGIIKQLNVDKKEFIRVNTIFPYILSKLAEKYNFKIIQLSTDCVFSGLKGNYIEEDISDAMDIYGKTKYLGELDSPHLTIRTSVIGHELNSNYELVDWFLSQKEKVKGYSKAIFSGITTVELYKVILKLIEKDLSGLYHVSSTPINKYTLLNLIAKVYDKKIIIDKDKNFICDRSLNSDKLKSKINYIFPSWEEMIIELKNYV